MYQSHENRTCYFPPLLSNGEISFAPDAEGMIGYTMKDYAEKGVTSFDGIVVRSARRSGLCNNLGARLFPFGKFTFSEGAKLTSWNQSLTIEGGFFESNCQYEDGAGIDSQGFIHPDKNIYALRKTFTGISGTKKVSYDVTLCGYNENISEYMNVLYTKKQDGVGCIGFKMYGMSVFTGEIHAFVDTDFTVEPIENGIRLWFEVKDGETVSFYYCLEDNLGGVDFSKVLADYKETIDKAGFLGLLEECKQHFKEFFDLGYVKTSDDKLNQIYQTALYDIKCCTTKYSIAVGFNNVSWDGKYFAFDEYTSYLGLLGANRLALAKRVPEYRKNACLPVAIARGSDCHKTEETEDIAWFHWECGEVDNYELAAEGNWLDHIFHMPLIGLGAFEYYEYSQDKNYLAELYPMIRACAKFMTKKMVYRDGERVYVGKCTDMERLGAAVENPFMTACGVIKLLESCAKAANILNIDEAYAKECSETAEKLLNNLPVENGIYTPFLRCKQKSIAIFGGKFPFDVLEDNDEKMLLAWDDFEKNGRLYGNMYPVGNNISPWYAGWKALGYARAGMKEKALDALRQAYPSVGVFDEMFEINEASVCIRPWFTTAAGTFVSAVNEMLVKAEGKVITIMPGCPKSLDASFKLAAKGGIVVEATVKDGDLQSVMVTQNGLDVTNQYEIQF